VDFIVQMDRGPKLTQKMKKYYSGNRSGPYETLWSFARR
jgi:hypothetical protein